MWDMPDAGISDGMGSVHTEMMCVMRRSVREREERAASML
jgi:hypothetical protein